ncbi:MAG: hypothetical protein H7144_14950 [Burkholderiales bacterium]|nr:hypothetical protein [Phycisphaerae bacterium]
MSSIEQNNVDVRQLVRFLGIEGARAGLTQSKRLTVDMLRKLAEPLKLNLPEKATRQVLIDEMVKIASRRIDKPIHELFAMGENSLLEYFEQVEAEPAEILDILKELNVSPRREGRKTLFEFAARELSETGRFIRIAGKSEPSKSNSGNATYRP